MQPIITSPMPGYGTASTTYGITAEGEVYARRNSVLGAWTGAAQGGGQSWPLKDIVAIDYTISDWKTRRGDVFFKNSAAAVVVTWENVFRPAAKKKLADDFKSVAAALERRRQAELARKGNIAFSDKVLEMPMISGALYPGVYHRSFGVRDQIPQTNIKAGNWVSRGDVLCSLALMTSFLGSKTAVITAPVSGRILLNPADIFGNPKSTFCAIQLVEGEHFPDSIAASYRGFVEIALSHSKYLFRNGGSSLSDQQVQDALTNVRAGEYKRSDMNNDYYHSLGKTIDKRFGGLLVPGDSW